MKSPSLKAIEAASDSYSASVVISVHITSEIDTSEGAMRREILEKMEHNKKKNSIFGQMKNSFLVFRLFSPSPSSSKRESIIQQN